MSEFSVVKKIYKWHPFTNRAVGRPRSGWEDDVKKRSEKAESGKMVTPGPRSTLSGRKLLRKPRLFQSCSADDDEGEDCGSR